MGRLNGVRPFSSADLRSGRRGSRLSRTFQDSFAPEKGFSAPPGRGPRRTPPVFLFRPRYSCTLMTYSSESSESLFVRPLHWVHFALGDPTGGLCRQYSFQLPAAHKTQTLHHQGGSAPQSLKWRSRSGTAA